MEEQCFDFVEPDYFQAFKNLKKFNLNKLTPYNICKHSSPKFCSICMIPIENIVDEKSVKFHGESIVDLERYMDYSSLFFFTDFDPKTLNSCVIPVLNDMRFLIPYEIDESGKQEFIHNRENRLNYDYKKYIVYKKNGNEFKRHDSYDIVHKELEPIVDMYKSINVVDGNYLDVSESEDGLILKCELNPININDDISVENPNNSLKGFITITKKDIGNPLHQEIKISLDIETNNFGLIMDFAEISFVSLRNLK